MTLGSDWARTIASGYGRTGSAHRAPARRGARRAGRGEVPSATSPPAWGEQHRRPQAGRGGSTEGARRASTHARGLSGGGTRRTAWPVGPAGETSGMGGTAPCPLGTAPAVTGRGGSSSPPRPALRSLMRRWAGQIRPAPTWSLASPTPGDHPTRLWPPFDRADASGYEPTAKGTTPRSQRPDRPGDPTPSGPRPYKPLPPSRDRWGVRWAAPRAHPQLNAGMESTRPDPAHPPAIAIGSWRARAF